MVSLQFTGVNLLLMLRMWLRARVQGCFITWPQTNNKPVMTNYKANDGFRNVSAGGTISLVDKVLDSAMFTQGAIDAKV